MRFTIICLWWHIVLASKRCLDIKRRPPFGIKAKNNSIQTFARMDCIVEPPYFLSNAVENFIGEPLTFLRYNLKRPPKFWQKRFQFALALQISSIRLEHISQRCYEIFLSLALRNSLCPTFGKSGGLLQPFVEYCNIA
ncbi:hypothetical protein SE17_18515 [Kouleothrix aurantiaca]|uniref:Uncharacterized protein n=1 Tax=Kouleothrix aurantiaca TaxID=186479 RepID=A0A0P9F5X8_9CHLR|nr:hypothetical protein SE17_18515 [Kouleothrix aurantiaca]